MSLDRVQNSFYDPDDGSLEVVTVEGVQGQVAGGGGGPGQGQAIGFFGDPLNINPKVSLSFAIGPQETFVGTFDLAVPSLPEVVAAMGQVVTSPQGEADQIPVDAGTFTVTAVLTVTDLAGTNVLQVTAMGTTSPGDTSISADFNSADAETLTGVDLAWTGDGTNQVTSTAGGVYQSLLTVTGEWNA